MDFEEKQILKGNKHFQKLPHWIMMGKSLSTTTDKGKIAGKGKKWYNQYIKSGPPRNGEGETI
jgi:hypothetical protein